MQSNSSRRRFLTGGSAATLFASLHAAIAHAEAPAPALSTYELAVRPALAPYFLAASRYCNAASACMTASSTFPCLPWSIAASRCAMPSLVCGLSLALSLIHIYSCSISRIFASAAPRSSALYSSLAARVPSAKTSLIKLVTNSRCLMCFSHRGRAARRIVEASAKSPHLIAALAADVYKRQVRKIFG